MYLQYRERDSGLAGWLGQDRWMDKWLVAKAQFASSFSPLVRKYVYLYYKPFLSPLSPFAFCRMYDSSSSTGEIQKSPILPSLFPRKLGTPFHSSVEKRFPNA